MSKRAKVYLSDEGFGHIVRQKAISDALRRLTGGMDFTFQTDKHFDKATEILDGDFIRKYNNITWFKQASGSPDQELISKHFENYQERSDEFIMTEIEDWGEGYDFLLSDFVCEAFLLGKFKRIPSYGVAHFTWDWFFSKLFPPAVSTKVVARMINHVKLANMVFFPPFSPVEIVRYYSDKAIEVPFIVRSHERSTKRVKKAGKFNVLIMDSGAGVLKQSIDRSLEHLPGMTDFHFFMMEGAGLEADNITYIPKSEILLDYIPEMDLVIGRAGFNTITECIALRTPMLLLGEAMNPEMTENILHLKKVGLGSFVSMSGFESDLPNFLPRFIDTEYKVIQENMNNHNMQTNGADVIAEYILNDL